jgi:hypothetical protein
VLDGSQVAIAEERSSKRQPLSDDEARQLLGEVDTVVIARGKATRRQEATATSLDDLRGPTGGFRAPMLRRGRTLLVGFHPDAIGALLADATPAGRP